MGKNSANQAERIRNAAVRNGIYIPNNPEPTPIAIGANPFASATSEAFMPSAAPCLSADTLLLTRAGRFESESACGTAISGINARKSGAFGIRAESPIVPLTRRRV